MPTTSAPDAPRNFEKPLVAHARSPLTFQLTIRTRGALAFRARTRGRRSLRARRSLLRAGRLALRFRGRLRPRTRRRLVQPIQHPSQREVLVADERELAHFAEVHLCFDVELDPAVVTDVRRHAIALLEGQHRLHVETDPELQRHSAVVTMYAR